MSITITTKGLIGLYRDGVLVSEHTQERKALERILGDVEARGDGVYRIKYPEVEVVARRLHIVPVPVAVNEPPTAPLLTGTKGATGVVSLSWSASTPASGTTVAGYRVYRNGEALTYVTGLSTSYTGLSETLAHVFQVRAVSNAGVESSPSNQFTASWAYWSDGLGNPFVSGNIPENTPFSYTFEATEPAGEPITFDYDPATLPAGLDIVTPAQAGTTREMTIRSLTGLTPPDSYAVTVDLQEQVTTTGDLPTLTVSSSSGAWTFGQPIKKAAATWLQGPAGTQVEIRNRWSDGSAKFAVISGVNVGSVALTATGSNPYTTNHLTQAAMVAALSSCSITVGTQTVDVKASMLGGTPHRVVSTGPVCSNWIFRQSLSVGTDMSLWVDVRYYSNGQIELFPWVENGTLSTVTPVNYVAASVSVVLNGATVFTQSNLDFKALTRIPLLSGSDFAYRTSGAAITPTHDTAYLKATRLVPNLGWANPTYSLTQNYTPNTLAGVSTSMGAAGGEGSVLSPASSAYITSGASVAAYNAAITFGLSAGSWSVHYRVGSGEAISFAAYPNAPSGFPAPTGGTNGTWATSHLPGFAFLPYLLTGRWWFLDEMLFIGGWAYAEVATERFGSDGVMSPNRAGSMRYAAWALNTFAQALCAMPDTHPLRADYIAAWQNNVQWYRTKFVDGGTYKTSAYGTSWVSPQGTFGGYASNSNSPYGTPGGVLAWWDAIWMNNYLVVVFGTAHDYELPISTTAQANHVAVRDYGYKSIIGRCGGTTADNWRRFAAYSWPFGVDNIGLPLETNYTSAQAYSAYCTAFSLDPNMPATEGLTIKVHAENGDADMTTASSYGASAVAGLALAKDHGASGATDAWRRVSTASNFDSGFGAYYRGTSASFGMVPR